MLYCNFVIEDNGSLVFPIVYYYEKFRQPYMSSIQNLNNVFNDQYLTQMQSDMTIDTIVIQQSRVIFRQE
jgi:hypothetical protein